MKQSANCCPTCNRPIPPDLNLSPARRRILDIVNRHGEVTPEVLYAAIWGSDPNGGPGAKSLHVIVHGLNKQLAPYGMAIRCGSGKGAYRLISEAAE